MPTLDTDAAPPVDRGQHDRRRSEIPETRVVWLITQRQLTERSTLPSSAWGRRARRTHRLGASHGKQIRPAAAAASDGRRPGRGTGRGTGGREIPVQSALWMRSAVSSVQVMLSVRESRPLVMRRWPVFDWAVAPWFWPRTGAPRRCQSSLGYEPYDVCLPRLRRSSASR